MSIDFASIQLVFIVCLKGDCLLPVFAKMYQQLLELSNFSC